MAVLNHEIIIKDFHLLISNFQSCTKSKFQTSRELKEDKITVKPILFMACFLIKFEAILIENLL